MGRPGPSPQDLYPRRLALRGLELVLQHYGMADVTVKLNPDDPQQAFPGASPGEVRIFLDGWNQGQRPVVVVFLEGTTARVVVNQVRELVRSNHRADFKAEEVGILPMPGEPDVDMEVDLSSEIDLMGEKMRTAPQRPSTLPYRSGSTPSWRAATRGVRRR